MNEKVYSVDEIKSVISSKRAELAEIYSISKIFVFGSHAKGEQTSSSDIDFLIETSKPIDLFKYANLISYLEKLFNKKIDVGMPDGLKSIIKQDILKEAIQL